jgi:SRSO17 transposase
MGASTERFADYVSLMAQSLGHADRVEPFRGYCTGLMLPVKRKSVEPMAALCRQTGYARSTNACIIL